MMIQQIALYIADLGARGEKAESREGKRDQSMNRLGVSQSVAHTTREESEGREREEEGEQGEQQKWLRFERTSSLYIVLLSLPIIQQSMLE